MAIICHASWDLKGTCFSLSWNVILLTTLQIRCVPKTVFEIPCPQKERPEQMMSWGIMRNASFPWAELDNSFIDLCVWMLSVCQFAQQKVKVHMPLIVVLMTRCYNKYNVLKQVEVPDAYKNWQLIVWDGNWYLESQYLESWGRKLTSLRTPRGYSIVTLTRTVIEND